MLVCLVLLSSTIWKEQGPESQTGNLGVKTICSKTWIGVICMVRPPVRDGTVWPPSPHRYQCGTAHAALPKAGGGVGSPRAPPSTAAGLATSTCATFAMWSWRARRLPANRHSSSSLRRWLTPWRRLRQQQGGSGRHSWKRRKKMKVRRWHEDSSTTPPSCSWNQQHRIIMMIVVPISTYIIFLLSGIIMTASRVHLILL
mmetsp:Transcript_30337/g.49442  ORF Transcript_30337/g.49442 Transcript_30337/m.49442 type:complete len:200 (-) Transcript_30337:21-620(-)